MQKIKMVAVVTIVVLAVSGCRDDENKRLAEMAERNLERQAAQEARNTELQQQVAEGTKRLIESDAAARETIAELNRDVQAERASFSEQRDLLEGERRELAATRNRDPIIAEAIKFVAMIAACLVPLLIALHILRRTDDPEQASAVAELLLHDLVANQPKIARLVDASDKSTQAQSSKRLVDSSNHISHS